MNISHLGDALDHWKGSMIRRLEQELIDIHVVPMFTDADKWADSHIDVYSKLLNVRLENILMKNFLFYDEIRKKYFSDVSLRGDFDMFLDPDTGIEPQKPQKKKKKEYVFFDDIKSLMPNTGKRMLMIYQHSQPYNMRRSILDRLKQIQAELPGFYFFAYWAGSVSMVFISRQKTRIVSAENYFYRNFSPIVNVDNERIIRAESAT